MPLALQAPFGNWMEMPENLDGFDEAASDFAGVGAVSDPSEASFAPLTPDDRDAPPEFGADDGFFDVGDVPHPLPADEPSFQGVRDSGFDPAARRRQPEQPRKPGRSHTGAPQQPDMVPPADLFAEAAIIAACLDDVEAIALAQTAMRPDDFYDARHRFAFEAMCRLATRGDATDPIATYGELESSGHGNAVSRQYLTDLVFVAGSTHAVETYARRVSKLGMVRKVLDATHKLQQEGYRQGVDPDGFMDMVDRELRTALDSAVRGGPRHVKDLVQEVYERILRSAREGNEMTGTRTGFRDIDYKHLGLHKTDLIILAARPAMGKSAFALNLAYQVARQRRKDEPGASCKVAIFSLEMGDTQLVERFYSAASHVELTNLRKGTISPEDEANLRQAATELSDLDIYIDDTGALSPADIRARCKRLAMQGPIDLIVVDYLQLMKGTGGPRQSSENAIAECSQALKALAKELRCTVLALSQLNREVENRTGRKPQMSDLRGSGSIEQDADIIWFIHREHYYDNTKDEHLAELIIAKHRAGEIGTIKLHFEGKLVKFGTYDDRVNDEFAYGH